jgi:hypothetical protein
MLAGLYELLLLPNIHTLVTNGISRHAAKILDPTAKLH